MELETGERTPDRLDFTDMVERYITVIDGEAKFTFNDEAENNCIDQPCNLRIFTKG